MAALRVEWWMSVPYTLAHTLSRGKVRSVDDSHGQPYYGRARIAGASLLYGVAAVLTVLDAFRPDYAMDSIQLGLLLGTATVLLGVEAIQKVIG